MEKSEMPFSLLPVLLGGPHRRTRVWTGRDRRLVFPPGARRDLQDVGSPPLFPKPHFQVGNQVAQGEIVSVGASDDKDLDEVARQRGNEARLHAALALLAPPVERAKKLAFELLDETLRRQGILAGRDRGAGREDKTAFILGRDHNLPAFPVKLDGSPRNSSIGRRGHVLLSAHNLDLAHASASSAILTPGRGSVNECSSCSHQLLPARSAPPFLRGENIDNWVMAKRSNYQDRVIRNYYRNRDAIMVQRLGELVADLYLAEGKARVGLWKRIEQARETEGSAAGDRAYRRQR